MDTDERVAVLRNAVLNAVTSRTALIQKMLDPRRDFITECGFIDEPTAVDFNDMYEQEGIARRVVHIIPEESWQVDPLVYESEEPIETPFEKAWAELIADWDLFSVMARIDALSGIGRFGIVLLGVDDGLDLSQPAVAKDGRKLLYVRVFDESVVSIQKSETDASNPRYGQPTMYSINFESSTGGTTTSTTKQVHWTRCVHVADNRRMSEVLGISRLRPVFNRLQDLRKLLGGSAEMFWQGAFPGLSFEIDPRLLEAGAADIDTDSLKEQMQDYVNGLQRWLSTTGVSVKSLAPAVADPASHVAQQLKAIAITIGVPYRVFTGTEEGKLAGDQDAKSWAKRLSQRQNKYLTPILVKPFINRLVEVGVLPEPVELNVEWPDMLTPSEKEMADVAKVRTDAMKTYVQGDVEMLVPPEFYLTEVLGMEQEQAQAILDAVLSAEEKQPQAVLEE